MICSFPCFEDDKDWKLLPAFIILSLLGAYLEEKKGHAKNSSYKSIFDQGEIYCGITWFRQFLYHIIFSFLQEHAYNMLLIISQQDTDIYLLVFSFPYHSARQQILPKLLRLLVLDHNNICIPFVGYLIPW